MKAFLAEPNRAFLLGCVISALGLGYWIADGTGDDLGLVSFVCRFIHVGAAMIWVGMIWFVNFILLVALREAGDAERTALLSHVVPRMTALLSLASHVVVASGAVLLLTTGYVLDRWVFPSSVYIPSARVLMLWIGVIAGIAMWGIVHGVIRPGVVTVLEKLEKPDAIAAARARVGTAARINLVLAVPVTFAMIAAAHLF
ncbi:MAG: hypothetical protein AB7L90_00600 [Hyphomicrobiaceae bacterium]